jgi:hypothetical protein|nr:MAG TPA: endosialidase chaperone [Caudoviricetes sp.]
MALLKFFEGKEGSYSSSSHSGGLYFAKDTGVILFKGVKYGSKQDLSNYATKSDISSLQSKLNEKADADHTHSKSDITDLGLASSSQDGLMSTSDKSLFDKYKLMWSDQYGTRTSNYIPVLGVMPNQYNGDLRLDLIRNNYNTSQCTSEQVVIPNATTSNAGAMSAEDKKNLDNLVGDKSIVKKVYFNKSSSVTSPNNTLSHDIGVENNKVGFLFGSPLVAMYHNYDDPTGDPGYVETIQVTMLDATSSRNGYMTKTQASQLSSLYSAHNRKTYLPLSGGTVTGAVAFNGGFRINNAPLELMGEGIEIYHATPFIDFHYNKSSADYTSRIIESSSGVLKINEVSLSNGQVTATKVTQTSDIRLKENISTIVEDTDKIKKVKFFEFNYISDKNKTKSYGVIAQDLEEVGLKNLVIEDADGYKSVDYISLLVLEIQRLRNEVNTLKSKIR